MSENPYAVMKMTDYGTALADIADDLATVFGGNVPAVQQYLGALYLHFRKTPTLQGCSPGTIKDCVLSMALNGLDIRNEGEAYLIPFDVTLKDANGKPIMVPDPEDANGRKKIPQKEKQCTLLTGYRGRRKQALTHEAVLDAYAEAVRANDTFVYHGKTEKPEHVYNGTLDTPNPFAPRGPLVGFYAVVELEGQRFRCEIMSLDEVKKHRDQFSRAKESAFWTETRNGVENHNFEMMACKTVLRRVCDPRVIPMTPAIRQQIESEEQTIKDVTNTRQPEYVPATSDIPDSPARMQQRHDDLFGEPTNPTAYDPVTQTEYDPETGEEIPPGVGVQPEMPLGDHRTATTEPRGA